MKRKVIVVPVMMVLGASAAMLPFACGGSNPGGGQDGTLPDAPSTDDAQPPTCGPNTLKYGAACNSNMDCCGGNCANGVCSYPACTSDNQACTTNQQCCSLMCNAGKCLALNPTCKTLGNMCTQNSECCSQLCAGGVCAPSSFCGQGGDVCSQNSDCCTGICTKVNNQPLGICSQNPPGGPANCGKVDGQLCAGGVLIDGSIPQCGGDCCSRACAPWGPTKIMICQPASGCHVVGDLCHKDSDCCGSAGLPGGSGMPVVCDKSGGYAVGICRNPQGCKPDGDVCKLKNTSCNSSCDCCSGNCEVKDTCHQDNVGVPRCSGPCVDAGGACASSANCCGKPCVPNPVDGGMPPYICWPTACVSCGGNCTNTADCCPGTSCILNPNSSFGTCGPCTDGGTPLPDGGCNQFGQLCNTSSDCCNGIPCSNGRCEPPPPT